MKFSRASRRCDGIVDEFGAIWWANMGSWKGGGDRGAWWDRPRRRTNHEGHESTRTRKGRASARLAWGRRPGGRGRRRRPSGCPRPTPNKELLVVGRRGAGRRPAVAGTAATLRVPETPPNRELFVVGGRGAGLGRRDDHRQSRERGERSAINNEIFCDFFPKRGNGLDRGCSLSEFRI